MDEKKFEYYLQRVTEESSFYVLTEIDDSILPRLEEAYWQESSPERREAITRIIWEYRNPASLAFLAQVLADPVESVWQEALNGMVAIGGCEVRELLSSLLAGVDHKKRDWIVEAIQQIEVRS